MVVWSQDDCMFCSLFLSYGDRGGISKRHLVIGLAQLCGSCLSLLFPFWEQLSCPRSLCYPPGTAASLKLLLFSPRAQSQEKELGVESRRALPDSLGQGFPALCVSIEWAATVMLRCYWFIFIFNTTSLPAPQKAWQSCCFPAELSSTVATCWKSLLVPEDVCLRQHQSHFLADKHSVPLKWLTSSFLQIQSILMTELRHPVLQLIWNRQDRAMVV